MSMLDILTIVHSFADTQTASRIRRTCRRLGILTPRTIVCKKPASYLKYEYRIDDKLHRLDGPAIESIYGSKHWYRGGVAHREYHPQCSSGYRIVYEVEGLRHREAGPSIIYPRCSSWYLRGRLHRKIGPTAGIYGMNEEIWYTLGQEHRLDGPVCEDVYMIRGVEHSIFHPMWGVWRVDGRIIRR